MKTHRWINKLSEYLYISYINMGHNFLMICFSVTYPDNRVLLLSVFFLFSPFIILLNDNSDKSIQSENLKEILS